MALVLLFSACAAQGSPSPTGPGLATAVSGVCQARAALPNQDEAKRAFTNVAHDPLHALAADPGLDRVLAARVLESMEQLEADFEDLATPERLGDDLEELHAAAAAALERVGLEVPACHT